MNPDAIVFKGRTFTPTDLELIREVVSTCGGLSRQELAKTVCELVGWRRPKGGLKTWECKELLSELDESGVIALPPLQVTKPKGTRTSVPCTEQGDEQELLEGKVKDVAPVLLQRVVEDSDRLLWRELVGRHHYLGHKVAFGAHLRYLVMVSRPNETVVGCLQLSSPAWKMAIRDQWIGWDDDTRRLNLQRIVNNSRFLILPWVRVRNLASHVLGRAMRQFPPDWEAAYGVRPLLVETLVDRHRFRGICYRAANWEYLGVTQGRGRMDRQHQRHGAEPKDLFVYPLIPQAREALRLPQEEEAPVLPRRQLVQG